MLIEKELSYQQVNSFIKAKTKIRFELKNDIWYERNQT